MPRPRSRSRRLSGLPAKVGLVVLLAIGVRGALVSWTSFGLAGDLLRHVVVETFPTQASRAAERIDGWLAAGRGQVELLADDPLFVRAAGSGRAAGVEGALDEALEASRILDGLWIVSAGGRVRAARGALPPAEIPGRLLAPGLHTLQWGDPPIVPLAVAPLRANGERKAGWLIGVYSPNALATLLTGDSLPGVGRGYIVDAGGRVLFRGVPAPALPTLPLGLLSAEDRPPTPYAAPDGAERIGTARALEHLGWHVAIVAHLDEGFGPARPLLWRIFILDMLLILLVAWVTFRITTGLVRPVETLADGARRIAEGDLDVDVPEARAGDELGTLTRTFNAMARKLRDDQAEIDAAHRQLREQNQALQAANEVLAQLSITDGLTKLHNHRFFQDHLTRELKRASRSGEALSLLLIDIDDFKALNDLHGHAGGDAVLARIGQRMNAAVRESDLLARYGGEEFVVLAATDLEGAVRLAEKLRISIEETPITLEQCGDVVSVTVSVGVARYKGDRKAFFRDADRALYAAKAAGKNCVVAEPDDAPVAADALPEVPT